MALNDLILRSSIHAPLTTKGSELTYAELDGNFIDLYDYLIAMNSDSGIAPYDNTATYTGTEYVSYNGNIYVHISATSTTGVLPDTDPTKWQLTSIGALAHQQNTDSYLGYNTAFAVSVNQIYDILNNQIINKTYTEFISKMNSGELLINRLYCITNANNYIDSGAYISSELKLYIRTIANSKISLKGFISFIAPKYDSFSNYDYTYPYLVGDIVGYGLFVYQCTSAISNGDTPDNDTSHWAIKSYISFPSYYTIKYFDVDFNLQNGGVNILKVYDNFNNTFGADDFLNANIPTLDTIGSNDVDTTSTLKAYGFNNGVYANKLINSSMITAKGGYMVNPMINNFLNKSVISCDEFINGTIQSNNLTNVTLNLTNGIFAGLITNTKISFAQNTALNVNYDTYISGGYLNEQGGNITATIDITGCGGVVDIDSYIGYSDIYGEFRFDCTSELIETIIKPNVYCPLVIKPNSLHSSITIKIWSLTSANDNQFISSDYSGNIDLFYDNGDYAVIEQIYIDGKYFWNVKYINKIV